MEVISLVKNRKHNSNNKRKSNYPSPVQRVDDLLVAEVRLAIQLGIPEDTIIKNYHITYSQLNYCKKRNVTFQDYYEKEVNNNENK